METLSLLAAACGAFNFFHTDLVSLISSSNNHSSHRVRFQRQSLYLKAISDKWTLVFPFPWYNCYSSNRSRISLKRSGKAANKGRSWDERTREHACDREPRASGEKQASAEERSRRSKRFQSSYCAKAGAKARGGEKRKVSFSPLHLPVHSSFLLSSQRSRRSPAETLATRRLERSDSPQMLAGYAFLSKAGRCNKYTNKLVIFDARSMLATDGNMLKRFVAHLCYGSLKVPWME